MEIGGGGENVFEMKFLFHLFVHCHKFVKIQKNLTYSGKCFTWYYFRQKESKAYKMIDIYGKKDKPVKFKKTMIDKHVIANPNFIFLFP
jgi:hypothetical protein